MEIKRGIPVSGGVAIGPALVHDTEWYRIPKRFVEPDQIEAEVARLHRALKAAAAEARGHEQTIHDRLGRQYAAIFEAHALLIEDPTLIGGATATHEPYVARTGARDRKNRCRVSGLDL